MTKSLGRSLKAPTYAALALAFSSFGDAFLYPFLPLNSEQVGISVTWIGIILSINRFVRIFSNTWVVHLFARHGLRLVTIVAVVLAIVSTAGYALASGIMVWILLRIVWGLAFSAMRIGTLAYALQNPHQGFTLGMSRGLQEAGPMLALLLAPLLLKLFATPTIFIILAVMSLPALYFAWNLPNIQENLSTKVSSSFLRFPNLLNSITFVSSFLIDGIVIVVLGVLFMKYKTAVSPLIATSLAAFYLSYRRVCLVILSPAGGWLADKVGLSKVFTSSLAMVILGLIMIIFGWIEVGAAIVFTFYSIHAAITPGNISQSQNHQLVSVAENATWRDLGAALGTLAGGLLLVSDYLISTFSISVFLLALLLLFHLGHMPKAVKIFYVRRFL